jgi:hypothetical protein
VRRVRCPAGHPGLLVQASVHVSSGGPALSRLSAAAHAWAAVELDATVAPQCGRPSVRSHSHHAAFAHVSCGGSCGGSDFVSLLVQVWWLFPVVVQTFVQCEPCHHFKLRGGYADVCSTAMLSPRATAAMSSAAARPSTLGFTISTVAHAWAAVQLGATVAPQCDRPSVQLL